MTPTTTVAPAPQAFPDALERALTAYQDRQERLAHPVGYWSGPRWLPSLAEEQVCCSAIRFPTQRSPYSLLNHCRTVGHVARLHGVDVSELRQAARAARPPKTHPARTRTCYKAVLRDRLTGELRSIYQRSLRYELGTCLAQRARPNHGGGYYVRATAGGAREAGLELVPEASRCEGEELVVLEVTCHGPWVDYPCACVDCFTAALMSSEPTADHGKLACSAITPVRVLDRLEVTEAARRSRHRNPLET